MKWYFDRVVIVAILVTIFLFPIFNPISSFAMHNSTLDPNTWIMSDNSTDLGTFTFPSLPDSEGKTEETTMIEQPSQYQWLTYNDPILQFSIEHPSNWNISQSEDMISFEIPDTYDDFDVIVEPILKDHSEYARDILNERRGSSENLELIGLNETSINGQPATRAQYHTGYLGGDGIMTLSYFMVTDDYTGYRLLYEIEDDDDTIDDDQFSLYLPLIERMVNSFRITR